MESGPEAQGLRVGESTASLIFRTFDVMVRCKQQVDECVSALEGS